MEIATRIAIEIVAQTTIGIDVAVKTTLVVIATASTTTQELHNPSKGCLITDSEPSPKRKLHLLVEAHPPESHPRSPQN